MATHMPHLQKNFQLTIENGFPQASIELVGVVHWLRCCPLCGSVHQILEGIGRDVPYTPLCQTHAALYKAELLAWHKLYPEVISYTSLQLVAKTS